MSSALFGHRPASFCFWVILASPIFTPFNLPLYFDMLKNLKKPAEATVLQTKIKSNHTRDTYYSHNKPRNHEETNSRGRRDGSPGHLDPPPVLRRRPEQHIILRRRRGASAGVRRDGQSHPTPLVLRRIPMRRQEQWWQHALRLPEGPAHHGRCH